MKQKKESFRDGLRRRFLAVIDEVQAAGIQKGEKITDKDIAAALSSQPSRIGQIRMGLVTPTIEMIVRACELYGYDLAYVIRGDHHEGAKRPATGVTLEKVYAELQQLREIQDRQFQLLLDQLIILKNEKAPLSAKAWAKKAGKN